MVPEPSARAKLKQAIEDAMKETRQKIGRLEKLVRPIAPENAVGRISRMEAIGEKSINESALAQARSLLIDLERAMSRIDDDEFGYCEECGDEVPVGRLILMPSSRYCVKCAGKFE